MEKIPLFIHFPVSESLTQAFPAVEESDAFHFHTLKLDSDLFGLMIDARPCVAIFSIPDASFRQEVCGLLESFRSMRESLGYPKRDPTLRTILVAEEKAISLERWHDLGVHEFIIAPILPRALAFKISRHYQRALASPVPQPFEEKEDIIVVRASPRMKENRAYGTGPAKTEVSLAEIAHPSRGRSFLGERSEAPEHYSMLASIPELKEDEGRWEQRTEEREESNAPRGPLWGWVWNDPAQSGARRPKWGFRGERPEYDSKRRAWKLSGENPELEMGREGERPEKLIGSIETNRGREIIVHNSEELRGDSGTGEAHKIDVLEVKQIVHKPLRAMGSTGTRSPAYRDHTAENPNIAEPLRGTDRKNPTGDADEQSQAEIEDIQSQDPEKPNKPGWTQHISQSQRALARTLISDRERTPKRTDDWHENRETPDGEPLPPDLEEISKKLLDGESEMHPRQKKSSHSEQSPDSTEPEEDRNTGTEGQQSNWRTLPSHSPSDPDPNLTNPYLDARQNKKGARQTSGGLDTDPPGQLSTPGNSSTDPRGRSLHNRGSSSEDELNEDPGVVQSRDPKSGSLKALGPSQSRNSRGMNVQSGQSDRQKESNMRLSKGSQPDDEGEMKVQSGQADPNTWSMQNLDEESGIAAKKKRSSEDEPASDAPTGRELFETGEKPSLELLSPELRAQIEEQFAKEMAESPESLMRGSQVRDEAWYRRFWQRVRKILKRLRD